MRKRRVAKLLGILYKPKLKAAYFVAIYTRFIICSDFFIYFSFVLYATLVSDPTSIRDRKWKLAS